MAQYKPDVPVAIPKFEIGELVEVAGVAQRARWCGRGLVYELAGAFIKVLWLKNGEMSSHWAGHLQHAARTK